MPDRHKTKPKAVRMPDGLQAWYEQQATAAGQPVNALLVTALEDYRTTHSGSTTPTPTQTNACPHPKARIHKGLCAACGTHIHT